MITNFEHITYELDDYELKLLPNIVKRLKLKIGKQSAVTSSSAVKAFKQAGYKMDAARWRKIIHYIRVNNLVPFLISTSKGYYIATTEHEVRQYLTSLKERINSITTVYDALEYQLKNKPMLDATKRIKTP